MKESFFWDTVAPVACVAFACTFVGFFLGIDVANNGNHRAAIEARIGRWVINAYTGEKQFVYGVE